MNKLGLALFLACLGIAPAQAQQIPAPVGTAAVACAFNSAPPTITTGNFGLAQCTSDGKLIVSATVSASVTGFRPTSSGTPIAVTTGGVTGALPSNTGEVVAYNVGATNTAFCALGASATTAATPILPGQGVGFGIFGDTQLTCITSTSTTTVNMVGGGGLPTGWGGSAGGSATSSGTVGLPAFSAWSSGTAGNSTQNVYCAPTASIAYNQAIVQFNQTTPITTGAITFEGSNDTAASNCSDGTWTTIPVALVINQDQFFPLTNPYSLVASTNQAFLVGLNGRRGVRIKLSTTITGAGTVTPFALLSPTEITDLSLLNPTAISQVTPGISNNITVSPLPRAARNTPGCTVGVASAQCLAAATAVNFLQLQNTNATSTNNIACNIVGGAAVLNSSTSIQLAPGQSVSWGPNTGGVPSGAINCIATSASSPLYVEWN